MLFLLIVAEVRWGHKDPTNDASPIVAYQELRLIRAMAKSNTPAWRLVFDELGYAPDFIVADAGTGIAAAIDAHFDPRTTHFIPSLWHVAQAVRTGLTATPGAVVDGRLLPGLGKHLAGLAREGAAMKGLSEWHEWWEQLKAMLVAAKLPVDRIRNRRRNYEDDMLRVLPALLANPEIPVSTGGFEKLIQNHVEPMLKMRRAVLGNIERTNALFDLVVAREHGAFLHLKDVAELLREDARKHGGWTYTLRQVTDPYPLGGRYSSLRDPTLVVTAAAERGLA